MNTDSRSSLSGVNFSLKPYTVKQLSELYGVSAKTFRRWLAPMGKQLGKKEGYYYNISQIKCIVRHLGVPGKVTVE